MIKESQNKSINQKPKGELQEFHFAGGLEYVPQTIKAESREEAEKVWAETRIKVEK